MGVSIEYVRWHLAIERLDALREPLRPHPQKYAQHCCQAVQEVADYCRRMTSDTAEDFSLQRSAKSRRPRRGAREEYEKHRDLETAFAAANAVVAASRAIESSSSAAVKSVAAAGRAVVYLRGSDVAHYAKEAADLIALLRNAGGD